MKGLLKYWAVTKFMH